MTSQRGYISQYLTKQRQSDTEIQSVNRMEKEKYLKNYAENRAGRLVQDPFFLKKLKMR